MNKLTIPKHPHKGLKIYCNECKIDNPICNHYEAHRYRVRVHVSGTKAKVKSKTFMTREYNQAVKQAIEFEKEMVANNYQSPTPTVIGNDFSLSGAIVRYNQYLGGHHPLAQKKKNVTKGHQDESIKFCLLFAKIVKKRTDINKLRVVNVNDYDVSDFYKWAESHYSPRTFNKCMQALKTFFNYLIDDEDVIMKNPFRSCKRKKVEKGENLTLNKDEFNKILEAIDTTSPYQVLGGRGERKNMHKPYLKDAIKLFLLTGGRREEVVELRWKDIFVTINGAKVFKVANRKVERIDKLKDVDKYIPINADLIDLLDSMGYSDKRNSNDFILYPDRNEKTQTLIDAISKGFTHYRKAANIEKEVSLKNLRKTYISWVNRVMGNDTGLLTSHSTHQVLTAHYIDPLILTTIEEAALKIKVFGT